MLARCANGAAAGLANQLTCNFDVGSGVRGRRSRPMRHQRQLAKVLALVQHRDLHLALVAILLQANGHTAVLDEVHAIGRITCTYMYPNKLVRKPGSASLTGVRTLLDDLLVLGVHFRHQRIGQIQSFVVLEGGRNE